MNGIGFVFIDWVGLIAKIGFLLITIALMGGFGFAIGAAIGSAFGNKKDSADDGGFVGMVIGILAGVYILFFA